VAGGSELTLPQRPLVSILIPVYNRAKMIDQCIDSALAQTYEPIEIIVVDNASTDGTWDVCQRYARADNRVRVFRNETNLGPVRNWKRCIDEARGQLGKLLFSDDLIFPTYLEKTVPFLLDAQIGFVFTAVAVGRELAHTVTAYTWDTQPAVTDSAIFIHDALTQQLTLLSPGCALFRLNDMRQNLLMTVPSPSMHDFASHGAGIDLLLYLLTAHQYPQIAHVSEPLSFFRLHDGSITVNNFGWKLYRSYQQARIWFTVSLLNNSIMLQQLLAEIWLSYCKNERRLISPESCARLYTDKFTWSWRAAVTEFFKRLGTLLRKRLNQ